MGSMPLEQSALDLQLTVGREIACPVCDATGVCNVCNGSGRSSTNSRGYFIATVVNGSEEATEAQILREFHDKVCFPVPSHFSPHCENNFKRKNSREKIIQEWFFESIIKLVTQRVTLTQERTNHGNLYWL